MKTDNPAEVKTLAIKLLPIALLTLNLTFFFYLLPIHIAQEYMFLFGTLGGVITLVLTFWIFLFVTPKLFDRIPVLMGVLGISSLFVFGLCFIYKTSGFQSKQLAENGVHTKAVITDKTKFQGRRGKTVQSVNVHFTTGNREDTDASILVPVQYFEIFEKGMEVPIVYSSEHPTIADIDYRALGL